VVRQSQIRPSDFEIRPSDFEILLKRIEKGSGFESGKMCEKRVCAEFKKLSLDLLTRGFIKYFQWKQMQIGFNRYIAT